MLLLAVVPAVLIFASSYGGEIIFRAYLFALPFGAFLAASLWFPVDRASPGIRHGHARVVLLVFDALLVADFGIDNRLVFNDEEVAAADYMAEHARPGALIVEGTRDYPRQYRRYEQFDYLTWIGETPDPREAPADPAGTLASWLRDSETYNGGYVILTGRSGAPSQLSVPHCRARSTTSRRLSRRRTGSRSRSNRATPSCSRSRRNHDTRALGALATDGSTARPGMGDRFDHERAHRDHLRGPQRGEAPVRHALHPHGSRIFGHRSHHSTRPHRESHHRIARSVSFYLVVVSIALLGSPTWLLPVAGVFLAGLVSTVLRSRSRRRRAERVEDDRQPEVNPT